MTKLVKCSHNSEPGHSTRPWRIWKSNSSPACSSSLVRHMVQVSELAGVYLIGDTGKLNSKLGPCSAARVVLSRRALRHQRPEVTIQLATSATGHSYSLWAQSCLRYSRIYTLYLYHIYQFKNPIWAARLSRLYFKQSTLSALNTETPDRHRSQL